MRNARNKMNKHIKHGFVSSQFITQLQIILYVYLMVNGKYH